MTKATRGGKWLGFIFFSLHFIVQYEVSQNRKLGLEPGGRNGSRDLCGVLFTGSFPWLAWLAFLYNEAQMPRVGTAHSGLSPPTSMVNQENAPDLCMGQSERNSFFCLFVCFQLRFPLSRCLTLFTLCGYEKKKNLAKTTWEGRIYMIYQSQTQPITEGSQNRN